MQPTSHNLTRRERRAAGKKSSGLVVARGSRQRMPESNRATMDRRYAMRRNG